MGAGFVVVVVCLVALGSFGCYAVVDDQIPVRVAGFSNIDVRQPKCLNVSVVDINEAAKAYDISEEPEVLLEEIPHFNDLIYRLYETDEAKKGILEEYHSELSADGYSRLYSGEVHLGLFNVSFSYRGYLKQPLKGTAVVILASDSIPGHDTLVLYVTGLSTDVWDAVQWVQGQYEKLQG